MASEGDAKSPPSAPRASENEKVTNPRLMCVEYPAIVRNSENMLATLGGLETIGRVFDEPSRRLELRFRPDDPFAKPTCGERDNDRNTTRFLIKVRKNVNKLTGAYKMETELVGKVDEVFTFNNLCDYQYLPVHNKKVSERENYSTEKNSGEEEGDNCVSLLKELTFPQELSELSTSWLEEKQSEAAANFLPPAAFSRMDTPQEYLYRRETSALKDEVATPFIIGRTRQRRSHHTVYVSFDDLFSLKEITPDRPPQAAIDQLTVKLVDVESKMIVKKRFDECPIWSKLKLICVTKLSTEKIKLLLPVYAYYFTTGPWRNQWVRFGYNPIKASESAPWQTLDYRIRHRGGARSRVRAKRSYASYLLPYKSMSWSKSKTSIIDKEQLTQSSTAPSDTSDKRKLIKPTDDEVYAFRPGILPAHRQMFYQYRDLRLDEAQLILNNKLKQGTNAVCAAKGGWYAENTDQLLRDVISNEIANMLKDDRSDEEYLEEQMSRSEESSLSESDDND